MGREFVALNGGPIFKFTEAVSFVVNCESQDEVDHYWEKLSAGGDPKRQQCAAEGQVRSLMAGSSRGAGELLSNPILKIAKGHESDASNEENRHAT